MTSAEQEAAHHTRRRAQVDAFGTIVSTGAAMAGKSATVTRLYETAGRSIFKMARKHPIVIGALMAVAIIGWFASRSPSRRNKRRSRYEVA